MKFAPHEWRAMQERDDLAGKVGRLNVFLTSPQAAEIPEAERILMIEQMAHMRAYLDTLNRRCQLWVQREQQGAAP